MPESRSAVFNVPQTYPARPIDGILVAGFVAPNLEKGTYPSRIHGYLSEAGYQVDPETRDATAIMKNSCGTFSQP